MKKNLREAGITTRRKQAGVSLIEILISMLIVGVGVLGASNMQVFGLKSNQSAYLRTQASILAADIADRMRLNSRSAISGSYDAFTTVSYSTSMPDCKAEATGCNAGELATADLVEWAQAINGASGGVPLLPAGVGTIARTDGTNRFTVKVEWEEVSWDSEAGKNKVAKHDFAMNFSL